MCGRYKQEEAWQDYCQMMAEIGTTIVEPGVPLNLEARYDIRPTTQCVVFRPVDGGMELARLRWGLIPFFFRKNLKEWKATTINARAESVKEAASFKGAFARRRCLVATTGYYEWTGDKPPKQRWTQEPDDKRPIMFAGLWDRCTTADAGEVQSFTIVTQPSGTGPLSTVHTRAPVILEQNEWLRWLDTVADVDDLLEREPGHAFTVSPYIEGR